MPKPWSLKENRDALLYYFTMDRKQEEMRLFTSNVDSMDAQINKDLDIARVVIHRKSSYPPEKFRKTETVGLHWTEDGWKIVQFPEFYPLDPFEYLTGAESLATSKTPR